jgi:hypothetical protein
MAHESQRAVFRIEMIAVNVCAANNSAASDDSTLVCVVQLC